MQYMYYSQRYYIFHFHSRHRKKHLEWIDIDPDYKESTGLEMAQIETVLDCMEYKLQVH